MSSGAAASAGPIIRRERLMPTALIVEDEPEANKLLAMLLQLRGYQTVSAFRGDEALEKIRDRAPDVVFLDLMLPDMNGYDVCRSLKSSGKDSLIPVVIVTARLTAENRIQSFEVGADDYIPKPYTPDQVFDALEQSSPPGRTRSTPLGSRARVALDLCATTARDPAAAGAAPTALLQGGVCHRASDEVDRIGAAITELWSSVTDNSWSRWRDGWTRVATPYIYSLDPPRGQTLPIIRDEAGWLPRLARARPQPRRQRPWPMARFDEVVADGGESFAQAGQADWRPHGAIRPGTRREVKPGEMHGVIPADFTRTAHAIDSSRRCRPDPSGRPERVRSNPVAGPARLGRAIGGAGGRRDRLHRHQAMAGHQGSWIGSIHRGADTFATTGIASSISTAPTTARRPPHARASPAPTSPRRVLIRTGFIQAGGFVRCGRSRRRAEEDRRLRGTPSRSADAVQTGAARSTTTTCGDRPPARSRRPGLGHVPLERAVGGRRSGSSRRPAGHRRDQPSLAPSRIPPLPLRGDRQARPRRPGGRIDRDATTAGVACGASRFREPSGLRRAGVRGRRAARRQIAPGREAASPPSFGAARAPDVRAPARRLRTVPRPLGAPALAIHDRQARSILDDSRRQTVVRRLARRVTGLENGMGSAQPGGAVEDGMAGLGLTFVGSRLEFESGNDLDDGLG